jgi:hypothetical protein
MDRKPVDRAQLARDLELLGIIGDPTRGPLASLYRPAAPPVAARTLLTPRRQRWRRLLTAAISLAQRLRPAPVMPRSGPATVPAHGLPESRRGVREWKRLLFQS